MAFPPPAYYPPPRRQGVSTGAVVAISVTCAFFGMVAGCTVGIVAADGTNSVGHEATVTPAGTATPSRAAGAAGPASTKPTRQAARTIPGDGTFRVPQEVKPGTYRTAGDGEGLGGCYWSRLRNLSGDFESILANGHSRGPTTVTIRRTDKGFKTQGCQDWRKVG